MASANPAAAGAPAPSAANITGNGALPGLSRRRHCPPACASTTTSRSGRRRTPPATGLSS